MKSSIFIIMTVLSCITYTSALTYQEFQDQVELIKANQDKKLALHSLFQYRSGFIRVSTSHFTDEQKIQLGIVSNSKDDAADVPKIALTEEEIVIRKDYLSEVINAFATENDLEDFLGQLDQGLAVFSV
ncbi:hypothetical protein FJ366_03200 [Candidatus Dependentiae bacterium]|nr:hypothetical protein [Candidatus Dependentiae bacterium]